MHMSFEEFAKKLKTIPEYRLLTEQELRFHYNRALMLLRPENRN